MVDWFSGISNGVLVLQRFQIKKKSTTGANASGLDYNSREGLNAKILARILYIPHKVCNKANRNLPFSILSIEMAAFYFVGAIYI